MALRNAALLSMMLMAGLSAGGISPDELYLPKEKAPKAPQYPFTVEELKQLEAFDYWDDQKKAIKAKKKFLKKLKAKYETVL